MKKDISFLAAVLAGVLLAVSLAVGKWMKLQVEK